jgi:hypothetical protein
MTTIFQLISQKISPVDKKRKEQGELPLPCETAKRNRTAQYEAKVFNYLFHNKAALGIESVARFKNRLVDGQVILTDGKLLVVEVKLSMNWERACQAEWQLAQYLKRIALDPNRVDGAIVIFQEFSGDWKKPTGKNAWGWEAWYLHHGNVDGKPLHLLMFANGELQGYPHHVSTC